MRTSFGFSVGMLLLVACGERRGELREWQPSDHQPVPAAQQQSDQLAAAQEKGDPATRAAQALWGMRCASCHGESGRGDGSSRPPGSPMPDFTSIEPEEERTDAELAAVIASGRGMMPAFATEITEAGRMALVKHIRSLRAK